MISFFMPARTSCLVVVSFMLASGVVTQFVGGPAALNLNNSGSDYQRFFITDTDTAAAQWLGTNRNMHDPVYADHYAALRLTVPAYISENIMYDLTPTTIATSAYVYADQTNSVDGVTMSSDQTQTYTYQFPTVFLKEHKDTLYSNGQAEIYR